MQSASDKVNPDNPESLFDFLDGEEDTRAEQSSLHPSQDRTLRQHSSQRARSGGRDEAKLAKPYPVIRKPVSVERSGPLRAPRPGDPVEVPPALTNAGQEIPRRSVSSGRRNKDILVGDDLDLDLDLDFSDEDWPRSDHWADQTSRPFPSAPERGNSSVGRTLGYLVATVLIVAGIGSALYSVPQAQTWMDKTIATGKSLITGDVYVTPGVDDVDVAVSDSAPTSTADVAATAQTATASETAMPSDTATPSAITTPAAIEETAPVNAPKSLNTRFRETLARLEEFMAQGAVDDAQNLLQTMDRAVYGYGAPEFTAIKERIAEIKGGADIDAQAAAERLAQEQAIEAEAARLELQRVEQQRAAAEAARLEAERLEAERLEAERLEAERLEAERLEAERLEAERLEAERLEAERLEAERLAAETASPESARLEQGQLPSESEQLRADRLAQEQARLEQLEFARQERALLEQERIAQQRLAEEQAAQQEAASEASQPSDWQAVDSAGNQTETVEQIAARQREAARQQRLAESGGGTTSTEQLAFAETVEPAATPAQSASPQRITDSDLQRVYGQFSQLQNAIENRDVNAVIQLTERSGIRIQQMMQMFENNVSIQTRLRNVSTLDAAGEIQGTLQITRLERIDGSVTGPPLNLASVRLSAVRQGNGWSAIRW